MMQPSPAASVVISTYNNPRYLAMVLAGYARQTTSDFEVVVADDGSGGETTALLDRVRAGGFPVPLIHAWQPDQGFRQGRAMNLAALKSTGRQLVFTDGDCVPTSTMVTEHLRAARNKTLVVGGHIRLDEAASRKVNVPIVERGEHEALITSADRRRMLGWHLKNLFYIATGAARRPKIFGLNMSIDRPTFDALNGFDLRFVNKPRHDSDLRNRVRKAGLKVTCIWHRCIGIHLWHPEHKGRNGWKQANAYYRRKDLTIVAEQGLRELAQEIGSGMPSDARVAQSDA